MIERGRLSSGARQFSLLLVAGILLVGTACGAPRAILEEGHPLTLKVRGGLREGKGTFDHGSFDALLQKHVRKGRVDYAGVKKDHEALKKYLGRLAAADLRALPRDELMALLINSYNAYTLDLIVRNYPIESIRKISDPWKQEICTVGGEKVSLDFIEHKLLRVKELFGDARIHFAVNCASVGCPPIQARAFTAKGLEAQLEQATRDCLASSQYVVVKDGKVHVNEILNWFKEDFVRAKGSVSKFLIPYVSAEARKILEEKGDAALGYLPYDWGLNDV